MKNFLLAIIIFLFSFTGVLAQEPAGGEKQKKFWEDISFEEGTFLGNLNAKAVRLFGQIEIWRGEKKVSINDSLDKVEEKRAAEKDPKPAIKVFTLIHIIALSALLFIFSIQIVFYLVLAGVVFWLLRKIFGLLGRIFRKRSENS